MAPGFGAAERLPADRLAAANARRISCWTTFWLITLTTFSFFVPVEGGVRGLGETRGRPGPRFVGDGVNGAGEEGSSRGRFLGRPGPRFTGVVFDP